MDKGSLSKYCLNNQKIIYRIFCEVPCRKWIKGLNNLKNVYMQMIQGRNY